MKKSTTNIQPLFDNVLIRPLDAETKTASGIILPDSAKEKPQMGDCYGCRKGKMGPKGDKHPMVSQSWSKSNVQKMGRQ
jgi:chaperonin GroES